MKTSNNFLEASFYHLDFVCCFLAANCSNFLQNPDEFLFRSGNHSDGVSGSRARKLVKNVVGWVEISPNPYQSCPRAVCHFPVACFVLSQISATLLHLKVYLSAWAAITGYQTLGGFNRNLFLIVLED
jgi:hypothetical protein